MHERVLFLILIFAVAYLLKTLGVFERDHSKVLIDYVIYFSLPALAFREMRGIPLNPETFGVVLLAWTVILSSLCLSFLLGRLLGFEGGTLRSFLLVSSFGNTAFLGYPFAYAFFGGEGLTYAVLYDQLGSFPLVVSLGFLIARGGFSPRDALLFPPLPALGAGLLSRGFPLPGGVELFLDTVCASLVPVVLFAVGLRFELSDLRGSLKGALPALLMKMVGAPLLTLILIEALGLKGTGYRVALLESAMPPMIMAGVLALRYRLDEGLALSAITLGIPLSFATVSLLAGFAP